MNKYYVLIRDNTIGGTDYIIVTVPEGNDPLYGYGSWNFFAGPFNTWEDADHITYPDDNVLPNT